MVRVAVVLLLLALLPSAARAEKRIALLIGNQSYTSEIGRLANPHNDIVLLEQALKGLGFEVAIERDASLGALTRAVNAYARRVRGAGPNAVGFFYYSGHGAADTGINYLIPVDVRSAEDTELWDQSLRLTEITRKLKNEAGNATHFVVFDACRNNLKLKTTGSRSLVQSKGFVPVIQESGMLIAYATAEGELASDAGAGAGPYAKALAEEIVKPGVEAVAMFRRVQVRVRSAIGQEPWLGFSALGEVHLAGRGPPPVSAPQAQLPVRLSEAAEAWDRTKDTASIAVLEAFVARYKDTFYAELARERIEALGGQAPQRPRRRPGEEIAVVSPVRPTEMTPSARCDGMEMVVGNERRCLKPKDSFKDCPECPEMVVIPNGEFLMGSNDGHPDEKPVHKVTITKPFAVGKFEVTFAEWDACVAAGGCRHKPGDEGFGRGNRPVINVSWDDVTKDYLSWLSKRTGKSYRLLTEAEWEYAARAGSRTRYFWGDEIGKANANCGECASEKASPQTISVGSHPPNSFGLHDMHGNVFEWVQDCRQESYDGAPTDGSPWIAGDCSRRVRRGGSWGSKPQFLRSAFRSKFPSNGRDDSNGFRVARKLD